MIVGYLSWLEKILWKGNLDKYAYIHSRWIMAGIELNTQKSNIKWRKKGQGTKYTHKKKTQRKLNTGTTVKTRHL